MTFTREATAQLDWFVIEKLGPNPSGELILGIQQAADKVHDHACDCHGLRWIDCRKNHIKNNIAALVERAWDQMFALSEGAGLVCVHRITEPLPKEIFHVRDAHALRFTVPLLPPSVNHYKLPNQKGGWRITKAAQAFMDTVPIFARPAAPAEWPWGLINWTLRTFYEVDLVFHIHKPSFLRGDSDNLEKVAFDALTKCGAISDDRYIKYHTNRALAVENKTDERTEYTVRIVEGIK